jgi:hypothetical protein
MLVSETRARLIGTLIEEMGILFVNRDSKKHLFYQTNSYGFNDTILRTATKFSIVRLMVDGNLVYDIPVDVILARGEYLQFKEQGFELQIFLKIAIIETYKIS